MGWWLKGVILLGVCGFACASGVQPTCSKFLKDVSRYLTGNEADPIGVFQRSKKLGALVDSGFPKSLKDLWDGLGLDQEVFEAAPTPQWQVSLSRRWIRKLVPYSKVKGRPRLIHRLRPCHEEGALSIAQTLETAAEARETEVGMESRQSRNWRFGVYDAFGNLTGVSVFSTASGFDVEAPAPTTCLTCHYHAANGRFTNLPTAYWNSGKKIKRN